MFSVIKEVFGVSNLSEWAARFADNVRLCQLEEENNVTGLYQTQERYGDGVPCYSYTNPVYHVWINDKWALSCMSYHDAYAYYENHKKEV